MPARVTEKWSARTFSRGKSARRVFEVDGGPTTDQAAQDEVETSTNITYGYAHPLDPSLTVPKGGIDVELVVPGLYRVTIGYESSTISSGGGTPALFGKKWQVSPAEVIYEEVPADMLPPSTIPGSFPGTALIFQPVITSNRVPVGDGITRRISYYRFRMRRYESGTDVLTKNLAYQNRWNHDVVTLPRYGTAQIGELKIESIAAIEMQEQASTTAVLVEYVLEARPRRVVKYDGGSNVTIHGWHRRILDKGTLAWDGSKMCEIWRKHASQPGPVEEEVLLNGRGWPLLGNDYIVFMRNETTGATEVVPQPSPSADNAPPEGCTPESVPNGGGLALAATRAVYLNYDQTEGPIAYSGLNIAANN